MKSKILVMMITIVCFAQAIVFANENVVKLGIEISDETYKEEYKSGDTIIVKFNIVENCDNLGYLLGAIEFDKNFLELINTNELSVSSYDQLLNRNIQISPKYFSVGINNPKSENDDSNKIMFWIDSSNTSIGTGSFGEAKFNVINSFKDKEDLFKITKVEAGKFDLSEMYKVVFTKPFGKIESEEIVEEERIYTSQSGDNNSKKNENKENENKENENKEKGVVSTKKVTSKNNNDIVWLNASNWVVDELKKANEERIIPESLNGVDYTKPINRKQFAAIAVKLYENISKKSVDKVTNNPFEDTDDEYVLKAYELGITNGTSKTNFSPNSEITREQMATMMLRALNKAGIKTTVDMEKVEKFVDEDEIHTWGKEAIYYMASKGVIKGISSYENRFGVKNNATIEQAIAIALRCLSI